MLAAVARHPGPPSVLAIEEVPFPTVGPDEIVVKVGAAGVSYRDIVERNGTYRRDVTFPSIMGIEIAGTVEQVGEGVTRFQPGDRVADCGGRQAQFARCGAKALLASYGQHNLKFSQTATVHNYPDFRDRLC